MNNNTDLEKLDADFAALLEEDSKEDSATEMTYEDMYSSILLNGEVTFTIPAETEEKVKNGIKNCKSKQVTKDKESGLIPDNSTLSFSSILNTEFNGAIDLTVTANRKSTIKVYKVDIPEKL